MSSTIASSKEIVQQIQQLAGEHDPEKCFQCMKCTSGCETMRLLENQPHKVVLMARLGLIDELLDSGIIWTCTQCQKCKERCPQQVAPVDLFMALRVLAMKQEKDVPGGYMSAFQNIIETGFIGPTQEIVSRDFESYEPEDLGLQPLSNASEMALLGIMSLFEDED